MLVLVETTAAPSFVQILFGVTFSAELCVTVRMLIAQINS